MLNVSEAYKVAISKPNRELRSRITLDDKVFDDTNIQSIEYNSSIVAESDFEIGTAIMCTSQIELLDLDYSLGDYSFDSKELKLETGIKLEDNSFEYISLGLFTIEKPERSDRVIKLTASDRMHKFETPYVSNLSYPATLLQIAQDICTVAGVELINTSFANSDYVVNSKPVLDNVTCRKAIAQIAELAGGYARINRDGKLEIFNINTTIKNTISYAGDDFITQTDFDIADELIAGVIEVTRDNYITFSNKEQNLAMIDKVIVKLGAEETSAGYGENPYYIVDNIFCQNPSAVINNLYNALNGLSYMPFTAKWQGNPAIEPGDMITIKTISGRYNTIATSKKLSYHGGLREEYSAVGKSNTERNSTPKGSLTIDMENTKVEIKVLKDGIEQRVTKEDFETYVLQTAEVIKQKVSKGDDLKTEVIQNAESWKLSINGKLKGTKYEFDGTSFKIGDTTTGDNAEHAPTYSKWKHLDGSYTQVDANGFKHYNGLTTQEYHYLTTTIEYTDVFNGKTTVQLPDEFKNKNFSASLSITKVTAVGDQFFVRYWDAYIDNDSIDYVNATFDVWTQVRAADLYNDPTTNHISSLDNGNGIMNFTVTAIA